MANSEIWYLGEYSVADGKSEVFENLIRGGVDLEKAQGADVLHYDFYRDDATGKYLAIELFATSAAVLSHLERTGELIGKILEVAELTRFEIFGTPSQELQEAMAAFGARFASPVVGFSRVLKQD